MRTSEVLNTAADLIEQRGWTYNTPGWNDLQGDGPLCAEGAICAAMGLESRVSESPAHDALMEQMPWSPKWGATPRIWGWNDGTFWDLHREGWAVGDPEPTVAETIKLGTPAIVSTLRAAALIEAARESELSDEDLDAIAASLPDAHVVDGRLMVDIAGETVTFTAHRPVVAERVTA